MRMKRIVRSVSYIPVEDIVPGAMQPRRHFPAESLRELRDSIAEHGVIQPLTVRVKGERFELIAGERRLRAAKMAGLTEIPCILMDVDMENSGVIALIENIQRKDLDFVEEAEGISQLIRLFGMSQEEAARRLGKSQSAIANKLRILRLPEDVLRSLRLAGLGERHARTLLRLSTEDAQRNAAAHIVSRRMTVAAAEAYVDSLTQRQITPENFSQTPISEITSDFPDECQSSEADVAVAAEAEIEIEIEKETETETEKETQAETETDTDTEAKTETETNMKLDIVDLDGNTFQFPGEVSRRAKQRGVIPSASSNSTKKARSRTRFVMKDLRLFSNSLNHSLDLMRQGGINASLARSETENELVFTVTIPKK